MMLAALMSACAGTATKLQTVAVKIVAFNDFHGNLDTPPEGMLVDGVEVPAGGIAHLATLVDGLRARSRNFALVSAGDVVGASPLLSATFDDEPTIEAMNSLGLDFSAVGNHEFDRGPAHFERLRRGGCPANGCKSGKPFRGAQFPFLAANIFDAATGRRIFPPYAVKEYSGIKVAFIGVTLKDMPAVVSQANIAGLKFTDAADAVNELVPDLERQGIETIVVLVHQGGYTGGSYNECENLRGPIVDIVQRLDAAVDVVISGHTHRAYRCNLNGKILTSAASYGMLFTEVDLEIDPGSRNVVSANAVNRLVDVDVMPERAQSTLIDDYRRLAPALLRPVGRITQSISRRINADGESRMGQFIADAHLAATAEAGASIAFVQPGGIRAPFPLRKGGVVAYEDVFAVDPFGNALVTMTLTGGQVLRLLEQQWQNGLQQILQVSRGFSYAWNPRRPVGRRVLQDSITLDGEPLRREGSYRVTVNGFIAAGGDGFKVLLEGTDRTTGPLGREAVLSFMTEHSPLTPSPERRVRRTP